MSRYITKIDVFRIVQTNSNLGRREYITLHYIIADEKILSPVIIGTKIYLLLVEWPPFCFNPRRYSHVIIEKFLYLIEVK